MSDEADRADDASWAFLAPRDLREHDLPVQAALGFHRGRTEELLDRAAATIERLNRHLAEFHGARETWSREQERLESQLEEERKRAELLIGEAMLDAHKAAQALKAEAEALLLPAREDAERVLAEARRQAEELVNEAKAECRRLAAEAEQYKLLADDVRRRSAGVLRSALEELGEDVPRAVTELPEATPFRTAG